MNPELLRRVLVVEDEDLLRSLVAAEIARGGFDVASAATAAAALEVAAIFDPDAIVMDVDLGRGPSGFDVASVLARRSPGVAIVFLTNLAAPEAASVRAATLPPGSAYLRKTAVHEPGFIVAAIEAVLAGQDPRLSFRHDLTSPHGLKGLSVTQLEVLGLVAGGMTNQEIAARRGSSLRAVERIINRTFAALGLDEAAGGNARVLATRLYLDARGRP